MLSSKRLKGLRDILLLLFFQSSLMRLFSLLRVLSCSLEGCMDDQVLMSELLLHCLLHEFKDQWSVCETYLGFCRMDIDINVAAGERECKDDKGKSVLHQEGFIAFFDCFGEDVIIYQAPVYIEDLAGPVPAADRGLADPSLQPESFLLVLPVQLDQAAADLPSENRADDICLAAVSGGGKSGHGIDHELDTQMGIGQGKPAYIIIDIAGFSLGTLEELSAGRCVVEQVPHDEGAAFRSADLFKQPFASSFDLIPDAGQVLADFCNQLNTAHGTDAGQGFSPESEGADHSQVIHMCNLGGGMPEKRISNLGRVDSLSVVRDTDQGDPAVADFHRDGTGAGIERIFTQLLYDGSRALDHLSCRDFIYGCLFQYTDLSHDLLTSCGCQRLFSLFCSAYSVFIASIGVSVVTSISFSSRMTSSSVTVSKKDI